MFINSRTRGSWKIRMPSKIITSEGLTCKIVVVIRVQNVMHMEESDMGFTFYQSNYKIRDEFE